MKEEGEQRAFVKIESNLLVHWICSRMASDGKGVGSCDVRNTGAFLLHLHFKVLIHNERVHSDGEL